VPTTASVIGLIKKKFGEVGLDENSYTLGDAYRDDSFCLYTDGQHWFVGWNERGQRNELARFVGDIEAAEYLIFLIKKGSPVVPFPDLDWTEYARMP
jgi:hypothetical protein